MTPLNFDSHVSPVAHPDKIYSVSDITNLIKDILEKTVDTVWIEGEISNYTHHSSGHRYFTLKDEAASLKCVMWRQSDRALNFEPATGLRVRAHGRVTVYPPHGVYQLIVSRMIPVGVGSLEIAFQKLKEKLMREGLFDPERKRPIPALPNVVGLITSPTGAALEDMTRTITDRFPGLQIVLCPSRVQGAGAAAEIVTAIRLLNQRNDIDVIIAGRGGGSLEDLWPFNEEIVARAMATSRIPMISAVGHEIDLTISDMVADCRAATPTAAAQIVTEGWLRVRDAMPVLSANLQRAMRQLTNQRRAELNHLRMSHALRRPGDQLDYWSQRLDQCSDGARKLMRQQLEIRKQTIASLAARLIALSPDAVLRRGYSITRLKGERKALRDVSVLQPGMQIETHLSRDVIYSDVTGWQNRVADDSETG